MIRRIIAWSIPALLLLAVLVGFLILPRLPFVRKWRAAQLANEALAEMTGGDWTTAYRLTLAAYQLAPLEPGPLRAAARLNAAAGMPQALTFFRGLIQSGQATTDDEIDFATALLQSGSFPAFVEQIGELQARLGDDLRVGLLLARYAIVSGDIASAERILTLALAGSDAGEKVNTARFAEAARLLSELPTASALHTASTWFLNTPPPPGDIRRAGDLHKLLRRPDLPEQRRAEVLAALTTLPGERFNALLEDASVRIAANPSLADSVAASLRREALSDAERQLLAAAMIRWGLHEETLRYLPLREARRRRDLFLIWLDATTAAGRWDEARNALSSTDIPLESLLRELYLARCEAELGRLEAAAIGFERAARMPTEDRELLFYLAGYFNQRDMPALAAIVLERLERDPITGRAAFEARLNLHRVRGETEGMLAVLIRMKERWPKDPAIASDVNYLTLLLGRELSPATERARLLMEANPDLFPLKMTYALGLLKTGKVPAALSLFEISRVRLADLLPGQRAIFAAILNANGMSDVVAGVLEGLRPESLLPEELALLSAPAHSANSGSGGVHVNP